MSTEGKRMILMVIDTEVGAVQRDIRRTGPKKDRWGNRQFDVREQHVERLMAARRELVAVSIS